jgi:hypothetical protein
MGELAIPFNDVVRVSIMIIIIIHLLGLAPVG